MKHTTLIGPLFALIFSTATSVFPQQSSVMHDHYVPGYLFNVYENNKLVAKKVSLTINAQKMKDGSTFVECNLVYILVWDETESISLESHHYSSANGTISNIEVDGNRIAFDISLSSIFSDRSIRIACDRSKSAWRYDVKALALWTDLGGSGTTKTEWEPVDEFKLPYSKFSVLFLNLTKEKKQ